MKNIVALVTLYNPNKNVVQNIELISQQVSKVILSDNTPDIDNTDFFKGIKNSVYIPNKENLGLSKAFNKCFEIEDVKNSDYLIFFDQDSSIPEKLIETLIFDFEFLERKFKIACLGPNYFETNLGKIALLPKNSEPVENNCFSVPEVITSSMLTKYSILKEVEFWNEDIFLDYADYELCWRFLDCGYKNFITQNILLKHTLGAGVKKMYLPIKNKHLDVTYSAPFREYYQTREAVKLLKKKYVPSQWKKNFRINLTIRILMYLWYLPNRLQRFSFYIKGIFDGLRKKNGALKK